MDLLFFHGLVENGGEIWYYGIMKNRYLTDLALQKRTWHIPVGILSAFVSAVAIQVWVEDPPAGQDFFIWLFAHITVLALMALPLYFILRWRLRRRQAVRIADKLAGLRQRVIPLSELSRVLGISRADAKIADLKQKGFLQRIEIEDGSLVLDIPEQPEPAGAAEQPGDVLLRIRRLNDEIDDAAVSARIDRMEQVTASILDTLREHPERAEDARRFMNYYLPAALKLLESYRLMEKQSYQGENIQASRERIEAILDKLVAAAEQQQDKLFRAEAMNVEAEISVLETMMASDGLIKRD